MQMSSVIIVAEAKERNGVVRISNVAVCNLDIIHLTGSIQAIL